MRKGENENRGKWEMAKMGKGKKRENGEKGKMGKEENWKGVKWGNGNMGIWDFKEQYIHKGTHGQINQLCDKNGAF